MRSMLGWFGKREDRPLVYTFIGGLAIVAVGTLLLGGNEPLSDRSRFLLFNDETKSCQVALDRAKMFGVLPASATLSQSGKAFLMTQANMCNAKTGQDSFTIKIKSTCESGDTSKCVRLLTVTDNKGTYLFNRSRQD